MNESDKKQTDANSQNKNKISKMSHSLNSLWLFNLLNADFFHKTNKTGLDEFLE